MLADPLLVCREVLLADAAVVAEFDDRIYATPELPVGHGYPCVRLSHTGQSEYAPVGFRQAATAGIQVDVWAAEDQSFEDLSVLAETIMDSLTGVPRVAGALYIRPTFETRELDETVQPPLYRYRADLSVRVVRSS